MIMTTSVTTITGKTKSISFAARAALTPSLHKAWPWSPMRRIPDPRRNVAHPRKGRKSILWRIIIPRIPTPGAKPGECAHCLFQASPADPAEVPAKLTRNG